jgi:hypothetical protein
MHRKSRRKPLSRSSFTGFAGAWALSAGHSELIKLNGETHWPAGSAVGQKPPRKVISVVRCPISHVADRGELGERVGRCPITDALGGGSLRLGGADGLGNLGT